MANYPGSEYVKRLSEAVGVLKSMKQEAELALVLGTGLGDFVNSIENSHTITYSEIPHFKPSAVLGHAGKLVFGTVAGKHVVAMQGRVHCYEGHTGAEVAFGVRTLAMLGIKRFVITNAAATLEPSWIPGELMLIENHISLFCEDPSRGIYHPELGEQFYPQTDPYNLDAYNKLEPLAQEQGIFLRRGVYCSLPGPRFESSADIKALRILGAHAVGMSTVPEVLALLNLGVTDILGISLLTNLAAGLGETSPCHEEVLAAGEAAKPKFEKLARLIIEKI